MPHASAAGGHVISLDDRATRGNKACLVSVKTPELTENQAQDMLTELKELATTLGLEIITDRLVKIRRPHQRYLVGAGNAEAIRMDCVESGADVIIFDNELSPSQQRNWERFTELRVMDRREVILDIFAARASTREAVLQVELAKAEYMLPRLKRAWTHLSRQKGGVGLRGGDGEKQIEVDERLVRQRISKLQTELKSVRKRRGEQRKKRREIPIPNAAIVGYTNAGKSSLLNRLTAAGVKSEDKLFATLDPTTRRVLLDNKQVVLFTDTVGFVRKLPHDLIEAFKATLEEAVMATMLIHVVDITTEHIDDHMLTTRDVLKEIGADDKFTVTAFNKIDLVDRPYLIPRIRKQHPGCVFISSKTGAGIDGLLDVVKGYLEQDLCELALRIPSTHYNVVAMVHRTGKILSQEYVDDSILMTVRVPKATVDELLPFVAEK